MPDENAVSIEDLELALESEGVDIAAEDEEKDFESSFDNDSDGRAELVKSAEPEVETVLDAEPSEPASKAEPEPKEEPAPVENAEVLAIASRMRKIEGRYGTLNSQYNNLSSQYQKLAESQGKVKNEGEKPSVPAELSDKFKKLKDEDPELAAAMEEELELRTKKLIDSMPQAPSLDGYMSVEQARQAMDETRKLAVLDSQFPSWQDDISSNDFRLWYLTQNEEMKAYADSDDPRESSVMIKSYYDFMDSSKKEEEKQAAKKSSQRRLKAGVSPTRSSAAPAPVLNTEEDDFLAAYNT